MSGYVYVFSNESMPGILKVGMTERTPDERLKEANVSDTWRPPTPYKLEFAKKVNDVKNKEKTLHILLEQYINRIHPRREFFRVSQEEVRKFFDLMDGEMWTETSVEEEEKDEEDIFSESSRVKIKSEKGCRDMTKCFTNGQRIRHTIGINKTWIGTYDASKNRIVCDGNSYTSLSNFALLHNRVYNPTRMSTDGWTHCECEIEDGKWVSTYNL
jgi:hypothetical protein